MGKDGSLEDYDQRNVITRKEIYLKEYIKSISNQDQIFVMTLYEAKHLFSSFMVA